MTRRDVGPLIGLGALVAGVLFGQHAGANSASGALLAGGLALAAAWFVDGPARVAVAAVALALLGSASMQRALDGLEHHELVGAVARGETVALGGVLVSDPDGQRFGADALVRIDGVERIVLARASGDDAGRLRVLAAGDHVDIVGRLEPLPRTGFDARVKWDHVVAIVSDTEIRAFTPPQRSLAAVANHAREVVLRGTGPLDAEARALLAGFLLGDDRAIPDDVADDYRAAGLSHLLAVSGANVAFVLLAFTPLLRRMSLLPRTTIAIAIVVAFAAATRFEPSVLRASALATVAILTNFVGRPVSRVRALVLAIVALVVLDPFLLHSVGFHLSCAASAGIALLARPLAARLPGPALIREPLSVSIAAQLGVMPVLLVVFGTVPVLGPFANLLAMPAAEVLGVFGLVASVIGGIVPPVGVVVAPVTTLLVDWITTVAEVTAGVGGELDARGAAVVTIVGWLAMVARRARRPVSDPASR
ncbi:MAG: ComEC/Rec2 family competence protein [Acidimicrobiia bacterium]